MTPALHYQLMRALQAERIDRGPGHRPAVRARGGWLRGLPAALRRTSGRRGGTDRRTPDLVGAPGSCTTC
jgi:hypothetical protein